MPPSNEPSAPTMSNVVAVPLSIGIAILRYRLYEIDRIISRTIGWAIVTGVLITVFALAVFFVQRQLLAGSQFTTVTGKGDAGLPTPLPPLVKRLAYGIALPWAALTVIVYGMALAGGFVRVWGRDWTFTLSHFQRAFAFEWAPDGRMLFSGSADT